MDNSKRPKYCYGCQTEKPLSAFIPFARSFPALRNCKECLNKMYPHNPSARATLLKPGMITPKRSG